MFSSPQNGSKNDMPDRKTSKSRTSEIRTPRSRTQAYLQAVADSETRSIGEQPDSAGEAQVIARRGDAEGDRAYHISAALAALEARDRTDQLIGMPPTFEPPPRLYRASEIAAYFGLSRQTIHNYTTMGLITEEDRTPGNHRLYDESVFGALVRIQRLKARHRLQDIRRMLENEERRRGSSLPSQRTHADRAGKSE